MEFDAFTCRLGVEQGRLVQSDGSVSFVLGARSAGRVFELASGDYAEIAQSADLSGTSLIRANMRISVPNSLPVGLAWEVSLLVDGTKRAKTRCVAGRSRAITDLAMNVSKLSGVHEVALRLELVVV